MRWAGTGPGEEPRRVTCLWHDPPVHSAARTAMRALSQAATASSASARRPVASSLAMMPPTRLRADASAGTVSRPFTSSAVVQEPLQARHVLPDDPELGRAVGAWEDQKVGPIKEDPALRATLQPLFEEKHGGRPMSSPKDWVKTMAGLGSDSVR